MAAGARFNPGLAQRGNSGVALVSSFYQNAASIIRPVSRNLLNTNVVVDPPPRWMCENSFCITSIFNADEADAVRVILAPKLGVNWEDLQVDRDLQESVLLKCLFKMMRHNKSGSYTTLMIANSIIRLISQNLQAHMDAIFDTSGITHQDVSLCDFLVTYGMYTTCDPFEINQLDGICAKHYVFAVCLLLNLIGKGLNANYYTGWMTKRNRSYSAPLGISPTDQYTRLLRPSEHAAVQFNNEVKVWSPIRRMYFLFIWAFRSREDLLAQGCAIVIHLLRHAEMSNVSMIFVWIGILNPILLGWHELSRYVPYLCAAYAKYTSIETKFRKT